MLVKYAGEDTGAQDMRLWPGLVLQAAITDRKNLHHALRYKVEVVNDDQTTLARINDEGQIVGETFALLTPEVPAKMRLAHAMTIDSSQSRTMHGTVRLTQTSHVHMSLRRLIVALGRVPEGCQIEVE